MDNIFDVAKFLLDIESLGLDMSLPITTFPGSNDTMLNCFDDLGMELYSTRANIPTNDVEDQEMASVINFLDSSLHHQTTECQVQSSHDQLIALYDLSAFTDIDFSDQTPTMPSRTVRTDNLQSSPSSVRILPPLVPQGTSAFRPFSDHRPYSISSSEHTLKWVYDDWKISQTFTVERLHKKPRQTRRRVNHACDQCRRSKQKCTGGPLCERCKNRKSNCNFSKIQDHPLSPSLEIFGEL